MKNNSRLGVLFTLFHLFNTANCEASLHIPKCHPGSDVCVAKTLTQLIQRRVDYPTLEIPELDPYRPPNAWIIRTVGPFLPVNFDGNWTNVSIYGFDSVEFQQFKLPYHMAMHKDLRPIRLDNTIHGKLFIPNMELFANFESILKLLMWPMDAKGALNFNMTDVDVRVTIECDLIERNGKDYVATKRVHSQLNIPQLTQRSKYENISPFITHVANGILDSNWKHLLDSIRGDMETHIGNIVKAILDPIFNEIAITEFIYEQTEPEANPVESELQNRSSNSRSSSINVAQIIAFSLFAWISQFMSF